VVLASHLKNAGMPLRLPGTPAQALPVHAASGSLVQKPHRRTAARPDRHACRSAGGDGAGSHEGNGERAGPPLRTESRDPPQHPMGLPELDIFCRVHDPTRALLQKAMESLSLSARSTHRTLRMARTIADLGACEEIRLEHVAGARTHSTGGRPRITPATWSRSDGGMLPSGDQDPSDPSVLPSGRAPLAASRRPEPLSLAPVGSRWSGRCIRDLHQPQG
jgi:hypothetical protein